VKEKLVTPARDFGLFGNGKSSNEEEEVRMLGYFKLLDATRLNPAESMYFSPFPEKSIYKIGAKLMKTSLGFSKMWIFNLQNDSQSESHSSMSP